MGAVQRLIHTIDTFTDFSGRWLAWLSLAMALLTAIIVVARYGFDTGSIAAQEAVTYLHASLFTLGAAYTLKHGGHVRVDIFYREFSPRTRAWVNAVGGIVFLLPLCLFILGISWHYVTESWAIREGSPDAGGIPAVFLLKSLMPALALTLLLQAVSEVLRNALSLAGAWDYDG